MDEKKIGAHLEELDADLSVTHSMAAGSHWPTTALACAMLDAGLLEKAALLKIVDTMTEIVSAFSVKTEQDPRNSAFGLEAFRRQLEQMELRPGAVLGELEQIEIGASIEANHYHELQMRERRKDRGEDETS
ncbi:hypothetical protein QE369_002954 [Agrobacterium larrymoorei]|uniref:Uncharacterized protein n=1 Tax=Agrobacterium larrymoorei TaxID=160699 RepID=A0AAJ2BD08_9HYPH|nr:hypothetical protein [Agrobacterium larrymoorei]MDR6102757.1 hypothetical protein [Agrobacterium larrymoorei]